eukprot:5293065-Pyramimonas_sp.AAC.1
MAAAIDPLSVPFALKDFSTLLRKNVACWGKMGHHMRIVFGIASGVVQGCPAAGALFSFSMGPFPQRVRALIAASLARVRTMLAWPFVA